MRTLSSTSTGEFVNQGTVSFYNPSLPESIGGISRNGITMTPNNIRIGIGTTVQDTTLEFGNTVTQNGTTASGTLVGYAGSSNGTMTVTNPVLDIHQQPERSSTLVLHYKCYWFWSER